MIRKLCREDIDCVSDIHLAEFRNSFFCLLGKDFLRELYDGVIRLGTVQAYVAEEDGVIVGFVVGTTEPDRFFGKLLRSKLPTFSVILAGKAFSNPKVMFYGLQTLLYPYKANVGADAELLSVAVSRGCRHKGVGKALVEKLCDALIKQSARNIKVIVDEDNLPANSLYGKLGFTLVKTVTLYGKKMNVHMRSLA